MAQTGDAVLLREKLRRIALEDSRESSFNSISSSSFSFGSSSNTLVNERDLDIIQPFDHHQDIEISRPVTTLGYEDLHDFSISLSDGGGGMVQKIVLKIYFEDGQIKQKFIKKVLRLLKLHVEESKRIQAMKAIAKLPGTEFIAWDAKEMKLIVIGNGIDAVLMVSKLRKTYGYTEVISIGAAKVPEEEENEK
ncbi:HMA domain-containing protein [Forsythia ovata]|uniref:HMA domain-containing protein n=1 Tax=Forsythia ovata TaxID=205694 RepID=A0ABD1WDA6_9LAMI